jgi:hypothetical protein
MLSAEMAGLAGGGWPPSPDPAATGRACRPRIATLTLGADAGSVRAARDFTVAILRRRGMAERSADISVVVSELVTNALRHAGRGSGSTRSRRPIRLGLLRALRAVRGRRPRQGRSGAANARFPRRERRGTAHHRRAQRPVGCTTPDDAGKVVWALFRPRPAPPLPGPVPAQAGR